MMKRLQNKIAESRYALPVAAILTTALWASAGLKEDRLWIPFATLALSVLLMARLNDAYTLMRIYSRMVSCCLMAFTWMALSTFQNTANGLILLCVITAYQFLFAAYQDKHAPGYIFFAFTAFGCASFIFPQIVFFIPVLWILLITRIMAFSWRNIMASLLGLLFPYWIAAGWYVYDGQVENLLNILLPGELFSPLADYQSLPLSAMLNLSFLLILAVIGIIHFLSGSYKDKIKTRMFYEIFITMTLCCFVFIALQPHYYEMLLPILLVNEAPLVAHFVTFSNSRLSNITVIFMFLITLALTAFNTYGFAL